MSPKTKLAGPVWHQPCDIQGFLNFSLYWAQQVGAHLLQQLRQQNEQPVLEVLLMDLDEVHQRLQEHTEDLKRMKRTVISWCAIKKGRADQTQSSRTTRVSRISVCPTCLGESVFCSAGQKIQLDCWPQGLGLDNPDLRHARRIWIYRIIRFKNEEALWEVSIYWHISIRVQLYFKWKILTPPQLITILGSQSPRKQVNA